MTEYAPRSSQDLNPLFTSSHSHMALSHCSHNSGVNYVYGNNPVTYQTVGPPYPAFSAPCVPSQHGSTNAIYLPPSSIALQYHPSPPRVSTLPSQTRLLNGPAFYSSNDTGAAQQSQEFELRTPWIQDSLMMFETESQDSTNAETMMSEPVVPPLEGYPNVQEFDNLMTQ